MTKAIKPDKRLEAHGQLSHDLQRWGDEFQRDSEKIRNNINSIRKYPDRADVVDNLDRLVAESMDSLRKLEANFKHLEL